MPPPKKKPAPKKKTTRMKKSAPKKKSGARKPAKSAAKKPVSKKPRSKAARVPKAAILPWRLPLPGETEIGVVEDYFAHIGVISMILEKPLTVGDKIHVRGHTTDFTEPVESMQINHRAVHGAKSGDAVGIKVIGRCRKGDYVYRTA